MTAAETNLSHHVWHADHPPGHPDSTLWFHGTTREFDTFGPLGNHDTRNTFHWNNHLGGPHFAHHPQVARFFARGGHRTQTRSGAVHAVRLHLRRPAFYASEAALAAAALHAAWRADVIRAGDLTELDQDVEFTGSDDPFSTLFEEHTDLNATPDHVHAYLGTLDPDRAAHCPLLLTVADDFLSALGKAAYLCGHDRAEDDDLSRDEQVQSGHAAAYALFDQIGAALRAWLGIQGHDGLIYVNSVPPEFGLAAVPFSTDQIRPHRVTRIHPSKTLN